MVGQNILTIDNFPTTTVLKQYFSNCSFRHLLLKIGSKERLNTLSLHKIFIFKMHGRGFVAVKGNLLCLLLRNVQLQKMTEMIT